MKELIGLNSQILEVNFGDHSLRADGLWYWYSNWSCYFSSSSVIKQKDGKKRQIFRKNEHFLPPDTHKYMFMYVLPNQIFQILY